MGLLSGYKVVDLTDERGLAAGRILADLGADVVQVEPSDGSAARGQASEAEGAAPLWEAYAANKRGIAVDLDHPEGQRLVRQLATEADFLFESAEPGVQAGRGLGWDDVRAHHPGLVYTSITAFGQDGPKAHDAATDLTVWAAGGPLNFNRNDDRPPVRLSVPQAFLHAAADAAGGALMAHFERVASGRGQHVDVSAQACLGVATLGNIMAHAVGDTRPPVTPGSPGNRVDQSGSGTATDPRHRKWEVRDGLVEMHLGMGRAVGAFTNSFFQWIHSEGACDDELAAWDWRELPQMIAAGRITEADLDRARAVVRTFLAGKTKAQVLDATLDRKALGIGISEVTDLVESPQLHARGYFVPFGEGERQRVLPGPFAAISEDAFTYRRPAPLIGEHTDEVLTEWLQWDQAALVAMKDAGVIS